MSTHGGTESSLRLERQPSEAAEPPSSAGTDQLADAGTGDMSSGNPEEQPLFKLQELGTGSDACGHAGQVLRAEQQHLRHESRSADETNWFP